MKKSFKDLIKGIVATSIAAIAGTHGADAVPSVTFSESDLDLDMVSQGESKKDLSYKLVLKINSDNTYDIAGHRSHSSHRSHRSHSSHRSGSSHYSHSSHYSSTTTTRSTSGSISSFSSSVSPSSYRLGSRTLNKDLYGADVKLLTDNLVKYGYMNKSKVKTNYLGYVIYDENVVDAVKRFQKDMGLIADGIVGSTTISKLTAYEENFKKLGDRVLSVGMFGTDVTEMKNLLIEKGYLEGAESKGVSTFDVKLETALKAFLNDIGIEWAGKTDSDIIFYLKKKYND